MERNFLSCNGRAAYIHMFLSEFQKKKREKLHTKLFEELFLENFSNLVIYSNPKILRVKQISIMLIKNKTPPNHIKIKFET